MGTCRQRPDDNCGDRKGRSPHSGPTLNAPAAPRSSRQIPVIQFSLSMPYGYIAPIMSQPSRMRHTRTPPAGSPGLRGARRGGPAPMPARPELKLPFPVTRWGSRWRCRLRTLLGGSVPAVGLAPGRIDGEAWPWGQRISHPGHPTHTGNIESWTVWVAVTGSGKQTAPCATGGRPKVANP